MGFGAVLGGIAGVALPMIGDIVAADKSRSASNYQTDKNVEWQKEFAKHGIRWRVDDARAAGIHPLAGLGASTTSFSPIPAGDDGAAYYSRAGQRLGDSIQRASNVDEKKQRQVDLEIRQEQLRNMRLTNAGLQAELERGATTQPSMPVGQTPIGQEFGLPGQDQAIVNGNKQHTFVRPEINLSDQLGIEAGKSALEKFSVDQKGRLWRIPTQENAEVLESSAFDQAKYSLIRAGQHLVGLTHTLLPKTKAASRWRSEMRKLRPKAPKGYEYRYNGRLDMWVLRPQQNRFYDTDNEEMVGYIQ